MINLLHSKKDSTKFQILVEIAANQPNVRQREIAEIIGITPQAVSEYIKELTDEGLILSDGRVRYKVTKKGIEWVLERTAELKRYARYVMEDIISHVSVWTAIADENYRTGQKVSLVMRDGLLYANAKQEHAATGVLISDVKAGEDVGVTDLHGLIELGDVKITVCKVPRVERGGSKNVNLDALEELVKDSRYICALGVESLIALKRIGKEPNIMFGAKDSIVEAAFHGLSSVVVSVDEEVPQLLNRLESEGLVYELHDLRK
ncbi:MAG TPA: winged helix-turn-helix transcriptional regulator [Candidatus Nanoarchaeia archaeon]|nr:winged helix-turn-helix transcriptional regulator [Candidatus Nanoarchaeia archaeon]